MKIKVNLEKGESIEDADQFLEKALKLKKDSKEPERYHDQAFEDFVSEIDVQHKKLLEDLLEDIKVELKGGAL